MGKFKPQPNNEGWAFTKELADGTGYIRVSSRRKVNPHDGKMFDFVMSNLFAQRKHLFESGNGKLMDDVRKVDIAAAYGAITIDMSEVNAYRGIKNSKQNRDSNLKAGGRKSSPGFFVLKKLELHWGLFHFVWLILQLLNK